ncbi:threonine/homoserine/homoserine lactone efflux protein [Amycolatopsis lexingtonensis]|uniref:Threonine/homoserine/homoserine lactone efflux protein n=1 Tax=Amycolatopsis lexingtonensis TaxID=218822 RepID=A0ABR9HTH1_9PSEU|nr:LysE family translocator [Amycolatopsis lexingtonensis]MBE1494222.1 threonine/homoserine/homoserine lactone efflux protein [Amycolatopsis lexingtonensis]
MIPGTTAASFLLVVVLGAMSPGPDFVVVTRSALTGGRRAGIAAGLGIALGVFAWVVAIALGVAAVLTASAIAFTVVKLVGAAYLVLLGVKAWLAVRRGEYRDLGDDNPEPLKATAAFRQGLFTNLLNPKVAVYFLALLPQFLPADGSTLQTLELAAIATAGTVLWFVTLAVVVGALKKVFRDGRVRRGLDAVLGSLLVALGLKVAAETA